MQKTMFRPAVALLAFVLCAAPPALATADDDTPAQRATETAPPATPPDPSPSQPIQPQVEAAPIDRGAPDTENGRYTLNRASDHFIRLDTRTGQVSLCKPRDLGWACETAPDDRAALDSEIARLQNEVAALKKELAARTVPPETKTPDKPPGTSPPTTKAPEDKQAPPPSADAKPPPQDPDLKLPSDQDVDRMMAFLEKVWKRLIDMVQTMQKDVDRKG